MKKQILIVASFVLAVGAIVAPAGAQAVVYARIPFSFVVLGKTLPAGEYTLTSEPHELKIRDAEHRLVAVVLADEIAGRFKGASGQLTFHCYGERCFLGELESKRDGQGRQLLMSKMEREAAREQAGAYFAVMGRER
ncbi:MAG TPA: hypothetical protein VMX38_00515 [Verrucomicrobiae bacterium]|jgi:hypothetical protein|nr:hypothetical protein [Verrucomicrobiae bacterium]